MAPLSGKSAPSKIIPGSLPIVLGLDPGLGRTGFGLLQGDGTVGTALKTLGWGVIETTPNAPIGERLIELERDLNELLEAHKPDWAVIEQLFYFKNATTLIPVAQARGVLLLTLQRHAIPWAEYTPMQVKQALTGYGKATKAQMQEAVQARLDLDRLPRPDDAADGLALALTHYQFVGQIKRA